jgi:hypothetical protein
VDLISADPVTVGAPPVVTTKEIQNSKFNMSEQTGNSIQYSTDSIGKVIKITNYKTKVIERINWKGRAAILQVQKYQSTAGIDIDSSIVDASNYLPIAYYSSINTGKLKYNEQVTFEKGTAYITVVYADSSKENTFRYSDSSFLATTDREIIKFLPLEKGYAGQVKLVNAGLRNSALILYLKVLDITTVKIGTNGISCYKIGCAYNNLPADDKYPWFMYVTEDGHEFIKFENNFFVEARILN